MAKATQASIDRVKAHLTQQMQAGIENGTLTAYKAEKVKEQIALLNAALKEEQTASILREINKYMRLDIFAIYRHAIGQVN